MIGSLVRHIAHVHVQSVRSFRLLTIPFSIAGLVMLSVSALQAQTGNLSGVVRDTSGTPLSNVQVLISGGSRVALTGEHGEFAWRGLASGTYHLDAIRIGFAGVHKVVTIPPEGGDIHLEIVMQIATIRLSSVSVTATPTGSDPLDATQANVQLSGRELQRSLSSSIGQTLSKEPGMSVRFNGPLAATPVIRGLSGERILVLQDGERSADLSASAADHMNAIDPASAERIEVIRGPASLLYGNNAVGGVVNVISSDLITSIPSLRSGFVMGQGESAVKGGVVGAGVTLPLSSTLAVTARGNMRHVNDMRVGGGNTQPNTSGSTDNLALGAGYVGTKLSLAAAYRQMGFEYGIPFDDVAHEDHGDQLDEGDEHGKVRLDGVRHTGSLQGTYNTGKTLISSLKLDQTIQAYHHAETEADGEVGTRFALNMQSTNLLARTRTGRLTGAVGLQGVFKQYDPTGEEAFTPAADNSNMAVLVYQEVGLSRDADAEHIPKLQLGLRYDHFTIRTRPGEEIERFGESQSRHFDNVASSLGLSIPVSSVVSLSANVSRGFRAPAVEELFANGFHAAAGTFDYGNPDLKVEKSTSLEAGIRAQSPRVSAQFNAYYNQLSDYIAPVALQGGVQVDGDIVPSVTYSGRDATLTGIEGQLEATIIHRIVGGVMGDFTHAAIRNSSEVLPYMPAARIGGSLRYDNGRISAGGEVRRVFAQNRVLDDGLDIPTAAYTMLDLSAGWLFTVAGRQVHSVTLSVTNAADAQYRDATSRIKRFALNPGRNISLAYKLMY